MLLIVYIKLKKKKMTSNNDNANCENKLCSFPLPLHDSLNNNDQINMNNVIHWINSFEFTRPKKTIARDFSDASKNNKI